MPINISQVMPYIKYGYDLIPLHKPGNGGKRPLFNGWRSEEYDIKHLTTLVKRGYNLGVRLKADQLVVDVDPRNFPDDPFDVEMEISPPSKIDSLKKLEQELGIDLHKAPCVRTGGGGFHFYLSKPTDVTVVDSLPAYEGVEFKTLGRQVVSAGCVHHSGGIYEWSEGADLEDVPEIPEALLVMIRRPPPRTISGCGDLTSEDIQFCLDQLKVQDFASHDKWLQLMMACHHASAGDARYEFVSWSTGDPSYATQGFAIGRRWDSLSLEHSGGAVTAATLFKFILDTGGELPAGKAAADFDEVEEGIDEGASGENQLLKYMNQHYAVVNYEGKFRICLETEDEVFGGSRYVYMSERDFMALLKHRKFQIQSVEDGETKTDIVKAADWWLSQKERRQYKGVIFDPVKEHAEYLNLWRGFAVEPKKGDWALLRELIHTTLCNGCDEMTHYLLNWAAHMVQHPDAPAETAIVLQGAKGTGKGSFARALLSLAGRHGRQIANRKHLTSNFNSHLQDCLFLFLDEAYWAGDKGGEAVLKSLITEPTIFFERKGVPGIMGRNHLHIIMAANADWVVPAGMDGERRYAVAQVSDDRPSRAFFDSLHQQMENGGLQGLLYDLLKRDIKGWHPRDNVPVTEGLAKQKLFSLDPYEEWWFEALSSGSFNCYTRGTWGDGWVDVFTEDLTMTVKEHLQDSRVSLRSMQTRLGMMLKKFANAKRSRIAPYKDEMVKRDTNGQAYVYGIPSLEKCRKIFDAKLGRAHEW